MDLTVWCCGLNWTEYEESQITGICKHGNELLGSREQVILTNWESIKFSIATWYHEVR
jgi:hypothetical protein